MHNAKPLVLAALQTVKGLKDVFVSFPSSFKELPCASYYEASNVPDSAADDDEYLSEIVFVVDVWASTSEETSELTIEVDTAMKQAGFIREFAADVNNPDSTVKHKTTRYRLLI